MLPSATLVSARWTGEQIVTRRSSVTAASGQLDPDRIIIKTPCPSLLKLETFCSPSTTQTQKLKSSNQQAFNHHQQQPNTITMESAKQALNYVAETVQGAASGASKEANKEVAKDNNVNVGTRYVIS